MSLTVELGPTSATAIDLKVDYASIHGKGQLSSKHRTLSGKMYVYKHGDYIKNRFNVNYMSAPNAAIVNSWWENNTELLLFVNSSSGQPDAAIDYSEVFSDYTRVQATRGVNSEDYVKIVEDVSSDTHFVYEYFDNITPDTNFYFDVKLKAAGKNRVQIGVSDQVVWSYMQIYLDNGSYTNTDSDYIFYTEITSEPDDFWRAKVGVSISGVSTVSALVVLINSDGAAGWDGDGTSGIWAGDATLKGVVIESDVSSVLIVNKDKPINKFEKPHYNYLKGAIQLETY